MRKKFVQEQFARTRKNKNKSFARPTAFMSMLAILCLLLAPANTAYAATCETSPVSLDWATLPWDDTDVIGPDVDTFFDTSIAAKNPYHGLATASGGVSTFFSQTFNNVDGNGTDLTIYYSPNMAEGSTPDWYGPAHGAGINPDERVTAPTAARMTNDRNPTFNHPVHGLIPSATSYVFSFSQPVLFQEMISGSLSDVIDFESSVVRAFDDPLAEGNVVKATKYNNISNISDDSTLIQQFGNPSGPVTNNDLSNVSMDPDYTYDGNGVGQGIGDTGDDGIYHTIGTGLQSDDRYGRVLLAWENDPLQSIAMSTYVTGTPSQSDDDYLTTQASIIGAPFTFCVAATSIEPEPGPEPNPEPTPSPDDGGERLAPTGSNPATFAIIGLALLAMSVWATQYISRTRTSPVKISKG
jgi:hypothetical protein